MNTPHLNPKSIISWNVNGLRACVKKGFGEWLKESNPELLGLQETKAWRDQVLDELVEFEQDYEIHMAEAKKKGYSGVALFCHKDFLPEKVLEGLGVPEFDDEGRTLIAHYQDLVVFCCYFPNGSRDHSRVPYKMRYCEALINHAEKVQKETGKKVLIMGDINTAHTEIDLANPKSNKKSTGFLPEERSWVDQTLERGWHDIFRELTPNKNGHYTWWSYRSNCREKNVGWRIDYFLASKDLTKNVREVHHLSNVYGSDHCPIQVQLSWK